jgi:hypothetical protein
VTTTRRSIVSDVASAAAFPLREVVGDRAVARRPRRQRTGPQSEVCTSRAGCLRVRTFSGDPGPEGPTSRPCSEGESVTSRRVATVETPYPSMGFHFPFEVSVCPPRQHSFGPGDPDAPVNRRDRQSPGVGVDPASRFASTSPDPARSLVELGLGATNRASPLHESVRTTDGLRTPPGSRREGRCRPPWGS